MSTNQKFVKNTNTPPKDSPLWKVGEGWKRSEKGNDYTNLGEISHMELGVVLCEQFEAENTEPIEYVNHFFVPSYSQNGKFLIYAFPDKNSAEKKAKWEKPVKVPAELDFRERGIEEVTTRGEEQNQQQQLPIQASNTTASSTIETYSKPQTVGRTIDVVKDVEEIEAGDLPSIETAEQQGKYILPVDKVGKENFYFINEKGQRAFLYGRIISVKVGDN